MPNPNPARDQEIAAQAAREIRLMLSNVAGPFSLANGKFDGTIAAIILRAIEESRQPHYLSTACFHGKHSECRRTCKFCEEPCACKDCTHAEVEESRGQPEPSASGTSSDPRLGYIGRQQEPPK